MKFFRTRHNVAGSDIRFGQHQLTAPSLQLLRLWCSELYGKNCEAYDLADPTRACRNGIHLRRSELLLTGTSRQLIANASVLPEGSSGP
jgi:hypothetical protein